MNLVFTCCFCGKAIEYNDVISVLITINWAKEEEKQHSQQIFTHEQCLRNALNKKIPLYVFDLDES